MQNQTDTVVSFAQLGNAFASLRAPTIDAKPVSPLAAKIQAKRQAAKTAKPATPPVAAKPVKAAKPTQADRDAEAAKRAEQTSLARALASAAVAAFYNGKSLPFKAAGAKLSPLNLGSRVSDPSKRSAGLLLCLATYGAKAFNPDGTFTRDAFVVPARLLNPTAPAGLTINAKPESGCISDQRGRTISFTSPNATVLQLHFDAAFADILATHGEKAAKSFRTLLASYGVLDAKAHAAQSAIGKASPKRKAA